MTPLEIVQVAALEDNYFYIIHDPISGETALVDPGREAPIVAALEQKGWHPTYILNTHHHWDHTDANLSLKERYDLKIIGPAADRGRIPGIDIAVGEGDKVYIGDCEASIYFVPGHTKGHIAYYFDAAEALFSGDVLFSMGCGRLFEGTPDEMWHSLSKLMKLPNSTNIYGAHEYTVANSIFALSVEPKNADLVTHAAKVKQLRADNIPTVPTTLGLEKKINPFLRPMSDEIQEHLGMIGAPLPAVFKEVRRRKDHF